MKINPYTNFSTPLKNSYLPSSPSENCKVTTPKSKNKKTAAIAIGAGIALAAFIICKKRAGKIVKITDSNRFMLDNPYRQDLLEAIGLGANDPSVLRSIVGMEEYRSILKTFGISEEFYSPGKTLLSEAKDGFDLSNMRKGGFRANLHMHTVHSDGKMSIPELLEKASKYADEVASKLQGEQDAIIPSAPFTIALTDHDTIDGCKEAVKLIAENPEKYKNLRVVLGCEMSVENKSVEGLLRPIDEHMLLHCIDPFDKKLNGLIDSKKTERSKLAAAMIKKANEALVRYLPGAEPDLNLEEARELYPALKHGLTHIYLSTKDYIQFRTIFAQCFEKNDEIQKLLQAKGIDPKTISYLAPKDKYFKNIDGDFSSKYWEKYKVALRRYTSELLEISEQEAGSKMKITPEMESFFNYASRLSHEASPKLDLASAYIDMEDALSLLKAQKYGYAGIAHPALTNFSHYTNVPYTPSEMYGKLFENFKKMGLRRALFVENYYPYFGDISQREGLFKVIRLQSKNANLLSSGGLDSHGTSIFYSGK